MLGLAIIVRPEGTAAELFSSRFDTALILARSSQEWTPGVVTVDVGAVQGPFEDSDVRGVPNDVA